MTAAHFRRNRQVRELRVEVEERRAGDVALEVARAGRRRIGEVVAAVGEAHVSMTTWQDVRRGHLVGRLGERAEDDWSGGGGSSKRLAPPGGMLGVSVYELPPDGYGVYHFHHGSEELLIVLRGQPTLRTPTASGSWTRARPSTSRRGRRVRTVSRTARRSPSAS